MSAPAFAWAFEKGHELGLTSSQLVLLLYMADQANCIGSFFTGQPRMAKYTRLTERTIRELTPQLEALGLIRVEATPGKATRYHILRQPVGAEATSAPARASAPANGVTPEAASAHTPATASGVNGADPGNSRTAPRKLTAATPEATSADPYLPKKSTLKKREEGEDLRSGKKEAAAPPPTAPSWAPPKAPALGTTSGGGDRGAFRQPGRSNDAWLDAPSEDDALPKAEGQALDADPLDQPVDPARVASVLAELRHSLRMKAYPPRAATLDRDEQIELCDPKTRYVTKPLAPDVLAAIRNNEAVHRAVATKAGLP